MYRYLALLLAWTVPAFAAPWTGIVAPERAADWTAAGATLVNRTTRCGSAIAAYTGSAATINTAIANCTAGQFVELGAGTFTLSSAITFAGKSNVTLRGAGPDKTLLKIGASVSCPLGALVCLQGPSQLYPDGGPNFATWTAGYAQGSTTVTLASKANLAVGSLIMLRQTNDTSEQWPEVYQCNNAACATDGTSFTSSAQVQIVRVTSIPGTACPCAIGITPGVYMPNFRSASNARAEWASSAASVGQSVEDLSLQNTAGTGTTANYSFNNTRGSWIKNVRSVGGNRSHFMIYGAMNVTVRDSYAFGSLGTGAVSYGVEPLFSAAFLVENNIFHHMTSAMLLNEGASGGVFGYNYAIDSYYCPGGTPTGWMNASAFHHSAGINYILWEGNDTPGFISDAIHGSAHFVTAFRNRFQGYDPQGCSPSGGKTTQTIPMHIYALSRYFNVVGNVLGDDRRPHTTYENAVTSTSAPSNAPNADVSIFMLGFGGNQGLSSGVPNDPHVKESLLRWGNWDTVSDAAKFASGEVPSGLSKYSNAVPASQTLPASFYLSAKPAWFSSIAYPAIGPDVTGGMTSPYGIAGHAVKIPARACFEQLGGTGTETSPLGNFNAATCYVATVLPNAPTDVVVTQNLRH